MIEIKIIKEQYERMSDEELVRFAVNEAPKLTIESFHLLKSTFESRNLDLSILETVQVDKEIEAAIKLSEFEKITANEFAETIWQFAFDEKELGKSNQEIYEALLKKNINDKYAYMLIASLETKAKEIIESYNTEFIIGWVFTIAGALLLLYSFNLDALYVMALIWGSIMLIGGIIRLVISNSKKQKFQTIVEKIELEKKFESNLFQ